MATFTHGSTANFYLADSGATERNLSTAVDTVDFPRSADTAEVTALTNTAKAYIAGLTDATIKLSGPRDITIEGYVDGVVGVLTTWSYLPNGSASGKIKYSGSGIVTSYNPNSDVGDANKWAADIQVSGAVTRTVL